MSAFPQISRFYIEEDFVEEHFRSFTRENFLAQFGGNFNANNEYLTCDDAALICLLREDEIRAQLVRV